MGYIVADPKPVKPLKKAVCGGRYRYRSGHRHLAMGPAEIAANSIHQIPDLGLVEKYITLYLTERLSSPAVQAAGNALAISVNPDRKRSALAVIKNILTDAVYDVTSSIKIRHFCS